VKLTEVLRRTIVLATAIRRHWAEEAPTHYRNFPVIFLDEDPLPDPPQYEELRTLLLGLSPAARYLLLCVRYVGRGDLETDDLLDHYEEMSDTFRKPEWELSPDEDVQESLRRRFRWQSALVRVKRFRVPPRPGQAGDPMQLTLVGEDGFAIAPLPLDWQPSIEEAETLGTEQEDFAAMVQGRVDRGNIALYWGNEYHLDSSGEVVGS
jgi:hypothetical protein